MCKYCKRHIESDGIKYFTGYGGIRIIFDPEDVGYLLLTDNGMTYSIRYCPWCGYELK